jgi:tol-pal system protein YbgF
LKKSIFLLLLICCLHLSACATMQDLGIVKRDFTEQTDTLKSKEEIMDGKIRSLESQAESLATTTKTLTEGLATIRQGEADKGVDISNIKEKLEMLTGRVDVLQKDAAEIKSGMDKLNARMSVMEKFLDMEGGKPVAAVSNPDQADGIDTQGKSDDDRAYDTALNSFKEEKFEKARIEFEAYLVRYPNTDKAANATYWLAECFYFEGKFEQAILHYDKVIKNYPAADKVPVALLKEGLCFEKLGDKTTAKILFQQVAQIYPGTKEATVAQERLQKIE